MSLDRVPHIGQLTALDGARSSLALCVPVFAFGVTFGAFVTESGYGAMWAVTMSATTYAGSAQFAAATLLADGGSIASALLTVTLLNFRYLPMGIDMAPAITGPLARRLGLAHLLVDESWALGRDRDGRPSTALLFGVGITVLGAWTGGTALGAAAGDLVDPEVIGLDVAFVAILLSVVARRIGDTAGRGALAAGLLACAAIPLTPAGVPVLVAAVLGTVTVAWR